jgi:hypothetical protein
MALKYIIFFPHYYRPTIVRLNCIYLSKYNYIVVMHKAS